MYASMCTAVHVCVCSRSVFLVGVPNMLLLCFGWRSTQPLLTTGCSCTSCPSFWLVLLLCKPAGHALFAAEFPANRAGRPTPARHDLKSHVARQKLLVTYSDNPQTDALELIGQIEFPNLVLDAQVHVSKTST